MTVQRPLLRYFGGKWQLRHWITQHLPPHDFYAEPFAGAASILLAKQPAPKGEMLNDMNADIINLFRVMQDSAHAAELMRRLSWTPFASAELTISREPTTDPIERARRMIIRSFMGIEVAGTKGTASGFRMGNVDLSRMDQDGTRTFRNCATDWHHWKSQLTVIQERLSKVMLYEKDALEFIQLMDNPDCLLYIDPPYQHDTRSATRYAVEFDSHEQLTTHLLQTRAMVVLSGYPCPEYLRLEAAGWERIEKDWRANMSTRRRTESLWLSPNSKAGQLF